MASDTPRDDDGAEVDPWADIVADGLAEDGAASAFDFVDLDVGPSAPAREPVAAAAPDGDALEPDAADLDDGLSAAAAPASDAATSPADDVFADLVGDDDHASSGAVHEVAADGTGAGVAADDAFAEIAAADMPPALSVFSPDDATGWDSSSASDSDAFAAGVLDDMAPVEADAIAAATTGGAAAEDDDAFGWSMEARADAAPGASAEDDGAAWGDVVAATDDEQEGGMPAFATADAEVVVGPALGAAVGAAVATGTGAARPAARRPARGKGGIGQFLGILLGGALSIPIVIGILIGTMWLGRPDPIGMRRWLPGASFLLPPAPQARGGGGGQQPRTLDSLPTADVHADGAVPDPAVMAPPADDAGAPPVAAVAAAEPANPGSEEDAAAPGLAPADALASIPIPALPDPAALAAAVPLVPDPVAVVAPMPPEPEPLDLGPLDTAIEQATAAVAILDGAEDADPDRRRHMVAWYRSLSRVAEEVTALEALAVESGRPFEEATVRLDPLVAGLGPDGPRGGDLVRLARNWLTFSRRDSDGVLLPVTFQSARPVGPYWCSKVEIEDADGEVRELAVVSRQRPFLETGERCLVTGVIFDGGTVWAADVRSTDAPPAVPDGVDRADEGAAPGATADGSAEPAPVTDAPEVPSPAVEPSPAKAADIEVPEIKVPEIEVPEIEVPEIPVPDIGPPAAPAPAAPPVAAPEPPAAGSDASAADDF